MNIVEKIAAALLMIYCFLPRRTSICIAYPDFHSEYREILYGNTAKRGSAKNRN